jgi:hypothetical protein
MANTNQTGNEESPFSKTVMMMQIEKLEQEVLFYQDALKQATTSLQMISEIMGSYSEANQKASSFTDDDWNIFISMLDRYGTNPEWKAFLEAECVLRLIIQDFMRYKLGTAYAEVNRSGLSTDGIAEKVP